MSLFNSSRFEIGDPYKDKVSLLLHSNGANGSTSFIDETGKTITAFGNAQISTTGQFEFTADANVSTATRRATLLLYPL